MATNTIEVRTFIPAPSGLWVIVTLDKNDPWSEAFVSPVLYFAQIQDGDHVYLVPTWLNPANGVIYGVSTEECDHFAWVYRGFVVDGDFPLPFPIGDEEVYTFDTLPAELRSSVPNKNTAPNSMDDHRAELFDHVVELLREHPEGLTAREVYRKLHARADLVKGVLVRGTEGRDRRFRTEARSDGETVYFLQPDIQHV